MSISDFIKNDKGWFVISLLGIFGPILCMFLPSSTTMYFSPQDFTPWLISAIFSFLLVISYLIDSARDSTLATVFMSLISAGIVFGGLIWINTIWSFPDYGIILSWFLALCLWMIFLFIWFNRK